MAASKTLVLMGLLLAASGTSAVNLDINSATSINNAVKTIAGTVMSMYSNTSVTAGLFPTPYYFWESGLAWDGMINYWALTGDATYNSLVAGALLAQRGPDSNFMPPNQTTSEGNDDQSFWALAAMTAAERGLPSPNTTNVTWAQLAQNVFNSQVARWDEATCRGGLRWQIFAFNSGYNYKNALTNGNFVQLAARLALYTGNTTYLDWAQKAIQWSIDTGLIALNNGNSTNQLEGAVWDGFTPTSNCTSVNQIQWTANAGTYLSGAAYALNKTSTRFWNGASFAIYVAANSTFVLEGIVSEVACQSGRNCNVDQLAYRSVLARALANVRDLTTDSPLTSRPGCSGNSIDNNTDCGTLHDDINTILKASAKGAAAQCSGGTSGTVCGSDWSSGTWDGTQGLGQSLSALEILLANLPAVQRRSANSTSNATTASGGNVTPSSNTSNSSTIASASIATAYSASTFGLLAGLSFAVAFFL